MSEFQRVKHPLFGEYSTRSPIVGDLQVIDKPAVYANGQPRAAKPKISVAKKATEGKTANPTNGAEPAATPEEGSENDR